MFRQIHTETKYVIYHPGSREFFYLTSRGEYRFGWTLSLENAAYFDTKEGAEGHIRMTSKHDKSFHAAVVRQVKVIREYRISAEEPDDSVVADVVA